MNMFSSIFCYNHFTEKMFQNHEPYIQLGLKKLCYEYCEVKEHFDLKAGVPKVLKKDKRLEKWDSLYDDIMAINQEYTKDTNIHTNDDTNIICTYVANEHDYCA